MGGGRGAIIYLSGDYDLFGFGSGLECVTISDFLEIR
jgi:hypothetical protein